MIRYDVSYITADPRYNSLLMPKHYSSNKEAITKEEEYVRETNPKRSAATKIIGITIYRYDSSKQHWKTIYTRK